MTPAERWQRVQEICAWLEGLPEADVRTTLDGLDADPAMRADVLATLAALEAADTYRPPARAREPVVAAHPDMIGGVRIQARLGSGGSGEVFRGVRVVVGTEQPVAVKRFHPHRASAADLERIAREERLLASLTHPDIVRFLDAGVEQDGRPYLVMELVHGESITASCDERRLGVRERIVLFLAVCDAVAAAHRHLVVHLDLKPSNILVSTDGRPKLLDFGAAKLAGPDLNLTATEPLTLQYASPERLRGEAVSVACDVYSLGLVFFELMTGGWPFPRHATLVSVAERASGAATPTALSRVVTEDGAARRGVTLDRLRSTLRGDLDAIAAKAIAHEPTARYPAVADFSDDLRRYLDGEPVRARPPGVGYRLGKFVRRRAWEVASVALLIVGLTAAAIYSLAQARASEAAAQRARSQSHFLSSLFTIAGNDAASRTGMSVRELLTLADQRVSPVLAAQPDVASDVERSLAWGLVAQNAWDDALALAERARTRAAAQGDVARESAARALLSYVYYARNRPDDALRESRAALATWSSRRTSFDADLAATTLMMASQTLAYVNPPSAEPTPWLEACLAITRDHPQQTGPMVRPSCLYLLAAVRVNAEERFGDAEALLVDAIALQRADPGQRSALVMSLQLLGIVKRLTGRFAEDAVAQREAYEILGELQGATSTGTLWQRAVWATSLVGAGRAEDGYREAMAVLGEARRLYPDRGSPLLWTPLSAVSTAACYLERMDECESITREALETLGPTPPPNDARARTARGLLGLALAHRGEIAEARPLIQAAVDGTIASKRTSIFLPRWQAALTKTP